MQRFQEQARDLINSIGLNDLTSGFDSYYTGSFELGTMAWPDVDLNVRYESERRSEIFSIGARCLDLHPSWFELRCTEDEPASPGHFFLGFELVHLDVLWNVDIWFLSNAEYRSGIQWLSRMRDRLRPNDQELIVKLKRYLIDQKSYPNGIPSVDVYDAVMENTVSCAEDFQHWLENRRIT